MRTQVVPGFDADEHGVAERTGEDVPLLGFGGLVGGDQAQAHALADYGMVAGKDGCAAVSNQSSSANRPRGKLRRDRTAGRMPPP